MTTTKNSKAKPNKPKSATDKTPAATTTAAAPATFAPPQPSASQAAPAQGNMPFAPPPSPSAAFAPPAAPAPAPAPEPVVDPLDAVRDAVDGDTLGTLYNATPRENGAWVAAAPLAPARQLNFVEVSGEPNADGLIAARITAEGVAFFEANSDAGEGEGGSAPTAETDTAVLSKPAPDSPYKIRVDVPLGLVTPRGFSARESKYPFDALPIGGSFHIKGDPSAENRNERPSIKFASSVTAANKRYKDSTPLRHFVLRSVNASDPDGPGCRIHRDK